ncbi:MAG: TrmH family RNA methyltransferase [Clostridiales bacterium]|jgi:TrmH family RNA methyltransferase|nr:TrmH family RNA methyltransferase [Clostridiales bacterium]
MDLKKYKPSHDYSYTLGATLTHELIERKREHVRMVCLHPSYAPTDPKKDLGEICKNLSIPCVASIKAFNKLADKDNIFAIGVFGKYEDAISSALPHAVFANPSDAGNLGTNIRTGIGFGFHDFAIIEPGVDIFEPKAIRASMGAVFHARCSRFSSFDEYRDKFPGHALYLFMLKGRNALENAPRPSGPFSLVMGNEATGLPDSYLDLGESVRINHSRKIDSLNLSIAFGIAANAFAQNGEDWV